MINYYYILLFTVLRIESRVLPLLARTLWLELCTQSFCCSVIIVFKIGSLPNFTWPRTCSLPASASTRVKSHVPPCLDVSSFLNGILNSILSDFIFYFFIFYSYVHTMFGSFLPRPRTPCLTPPPRPLPLAYTPSLPGRNYFALISNFVVERI
jgi:hypothetical protein